MDSSRLKILVIDDEASILELIKLKLEREGFEVYTALDGISGFEAVNAVLPDLIILDILMPRMDGFQFYKKLKENGNTKHIPVLIMTGRGGMKDSFETLGVDGFLVKPFEPDELVSHIKKILADPVKKHSKRAVIAGTDQKKLRMMQEELQKKGFYVELAFDGAAALGKALKFLPDLFIVQSDMPEMNADDVVGILNH